MRILRALLPLEVSPCPWPPHHAARRRPPSQLCSRRRRSSPSPPPPPPRPAGAGPDSPVLIDEVYGGGGNSGAPFNRDFIELHNPGTAPVDVSGWSVQYASATGASWQVTKLGARAIPAGGSIVIGEALGANTALPGFDVDVDVDGTIAMSGTAGKVALVSSEQAITGATGIATRDDVVDFVGWGNAGDWAGTGAAPATTNATSVSRVQHANTADNRVDFVAGAPTPDSGGSTDPVDPVDPTEPVAASIAEVQGTGAVSPFTGQSVITSGFVTASYPVGGFNGFVIQTAGTGGAVDLGSHLASDALFVYAPQQVGAVALGDYVRVTGAVTEFNGLTELTVDPNGIEQLDAATASAPIPAEIAWPATDAERESLESMLVSFAEPFTIADTYSTMQYGEVGLAAGSAPLRQPTDVGRPGSAEAASAAADNAARGVHLDDGASTNFTSAANTGLTPPYLSLTEPIAVGGTAVLERPVIVDWRNDTWKLNPTSPLVGDGTGVDDGVTFTANRTDAPAAVGGDISVASFNVLNYFTTLGGDNPACVAYRDRSGAPITVKEGCDQRGAWDAANLARQQDKIVAAITGLDASVVGLMEIENSARLGEQADEALATLVGALNAAAGEQRWDYVRSAEVQPPIAEQDVITNAIIYQPAAVTPVGSAAMLADQSGAGQAFGNAREPIAQSFRATAGGEPFTVVVNHLKSKGSAGPWPGDADTGDGQGSSVESRVRQATALRDWVATDPTGTGAAAQYLLGDFNSYGFEDPLVVLYDAGFVDAEHHFELAKSSYVYGGLSGSLDHVLLNAAAAERSTGADVWQINGGEPVALEYSRYNAVGSLFYAADPYRSSDHDPVKVGLHAGLSASTTALALDRSTATTAEVVTASVTVTSDVPAAGTVEVLVDDVVAGSATVTDGTATVALSGLAVGPHALTARFTGSGTVAASVSAAVNLTVTAPVATIRSRTTLVALPPIHSQLWRTTLIAAVSSAGSTAGVVEFREGDTLVGTAVVRHGVASLKLPAKLSRGVHTYTATFVPSDTRVASSQDSARVRVLF
ncbi:ExeM/NucH family extracellular endonuclease [Microbacterium gorillae]|uniref:ExeM/NucH family extracellular endonuclease n=1 Tax=Microbacterium gorillae TaxID=1231063 RepID=UPI00069478B2|nr:ExeM/NucH family extracellular endonuclease [Microbacterium gorillae]